MIFKILFLFVCRYNHFLSVDNCIDFFFQNPLKIAKKYIPKLVRNNSYAPRDPKLKGTWRGRFRDRIEEFVQIEVRSVGFFMFCY